MVATSTLLVCDCYTTVEREVSTLRFHTTQRPGGTSGAGGAARCGVPSESRCCDPQIEPTPFTRQLPPSYTADISSFAYTSGVTRMFVTIAASIS
jgi:hypothetical protein